MHLILLISILIPIYQTDLTPIIKIAPAFEEPEFIEPQIIKEQVSNIPYFAEKFYKERKKNIVIDHRSFPTDCTNFVRAVFYAALKIDFFELAENEGIVSEYDFGVTAVYQLFKKKFKLKNKPEVGDLIFFDNTYDKNRNRKWDSILTHIAVVTEVEDDGTVVFIHGGTRRGIAKAYMNLNYPHEHKKEGKVINSYLQRQYSWYKGKTKLTAELFRSFGGFTQIP